MKKIDWYIIRKFLGTFIYGSMLFVLMAVVIDLTERIDDFLEKEAPFNAIVFDYYFNFIPHIYFILSPLFISIAVVFFTSRLAYNSEIVAILASGVSFYRLLLGPYMFSAFLLVGLQLYANHYVVPDSNKGRLAFEEVYFKKKYKGRDRNIHMQLDSTTYIFMESYVAKDSLGKRFTLEKIEDRKMSYKLEANRIQWDGKTKKWKIKNFSSRSIKGMDETLRKGEEMDTVLQMHPSDFKRQVKEKEAMTRPELTGHISRETLRGAPNLEFYEVEHHRRTANSWATIILTAMAFALASRKSRGGFGFHIFVSLTICSAYILFMQVSTTFATNGNLSPELSVWIPNILFGLLSVVLIYTAPK